MTSQKLISLSWQIGTFLAGAIITWLFLFIPTPRQFGLAFRYDFLPVIPPLVLLVYLLFQLPDKVSRLFLFGIISAILVLPVAGLWASGQSEQYLLGGIIPFSDARSYFTDSRRLAEGVPFITGASRRPLFTAMLASIQWMTGQNLYITIAMLTFIVGVTLFFAVEELKSHEGIIAAVVFLIFLFCYSRILVGKTLSEFLGLPFGLLSLVFLMRGAIQKKLKYILLGLVLQSLALNARAGAFIVLPMIALWTGWHFRKSHLFHWKSFLLACIAIAIGFVVNLGTFRAYSSPESVPFGNFSHTIYGLARGGLGWTQIYTDHPETWDMQSDVQANYIYSLTIESITHKPMNLVKGIVSSYQTFFSLDDYYGSIGWFGGQGTIGNISRIGFYVLLILGLIFCIKDFKKPLRSFFVFSFIGIVFSIPFAPPIDSNRMRAYAATIPFFAAIPGIGLASLLNYLPWRFLHSRETAIQSLTPAKGLSALLFLLMTLIPVFPYKLTPIVAAPQMVCPNGLKQVSFRILPGNYIRIIDQDSSPLDQVPLIRNKTFATRVHNLPNWETYPLFTEVKPGQVILVDLDLQKKDPMILIADWDEVADRQGIQTVCGRPSDDKMLREYNVYFAEEYMPR